MRKPLRWALLILLGILLLALVWFVSTGDAEISALRNILQYKAVTALGGPKMLSGQPAGALAGSIRDAGGSPLAGATVLLSSPLGHAYSCRNRHPGPATRSATCRQAAMCRSPASAATTTPCGSAASPGCAASTL